MTNEELHRAVQSSKCKKVIRVSPKSKKKHSRSKETGTGSPYKMNADSAGGHDKLPNGISEIDKNELELKEAFELFDQNKDGKISSEELGCVLRSLRHNYSPDEVDEMIKNADTNENGYVEFDEFLTMMRRWAHNSQAGADEQSCSTSDDKKEDEKREAFRVFDMDGNGYIDKHELRYVMRRLGENLSDDDIKDMFKEADLNGDGYIDYDEFSRLLHYLQ